MSIQELLRSKTLPLRAIVGDSAQHFQPLIGAKPVISSPGPAGLSPASPNYTTYRGLPCPVAALSGANHWAELAVIPVSFVMSPGSPTLSLTTRIIYSTHQFNPGVIRIDRVYQVSSLTSETGGPVWEIMMVVYDPIPVRFLIRPSPSSP